MKSLLRMALLVVGRDSQQRQARTTNELILNNDEKWNSETNWVVWREAQRHIPTRAQNCESTAIGN